jgi:hypothetical protein
MSSLQPMKDEANNKQKTYEKNLHQLWALIQGETPEGKKEIIEKLAPDTITALRSIANPYKKPIYLGHKNKVLAFSTINITETYSRRFAMTTLIGFIYRMLDEYKPDELDKYISEDDIKFAAPFHKHIAALKRRKPEEQLLKQLEDLRLHIQELKKDNPQAEQLQKAAIDSYLIRAKILKFRLYWCREDYNVMKERCDRLSKDLQENKTYITQVNKDIAELENKRDIRIKYDDTRLKKRQCATEQASTEQTAPPTQEELNEMKLQLAAEGLPEGMTIEDMLKRPHHYHAAIKSKQAISAQKLEAQTKIQHDLDERTISINNYNLRIEVLNKKFKELKIEYLEKTDTTQRSKTDTTQRSKTDTTQRSKIGKKRAAIEVPEFDDLEVDIYHPTEEDYESIGAEVKKELGITKTAEEYTIEIQNQIEKFLDSYLRWNPDNHVRCAYKPNYNDPQRTPLEKTPTDAKERVILPPDDTFFRWARYIDNNYECLRQATDDIYCEKSDFEHAILPLEVFEGKTTEEAEAAFDNFKRQHANEFESEIFSATFGKWSLLSSWEQNREVRDFYTEKTEIIKRIIDQHKEDQRMGTKLMKDRAGRKKKENVKNAGPDDKGLVQYREELKVNKALERHGGKHMSEIHSPDIINPEDIPRDTEESTMQEVEVGVHVIKPHISGNRRRIRGESEQWKFHIPAEDLPEGSVDIMNASEFQKKFGEMLDDI